MLCAESADLLTIDDYEFMTITTELTVIVVIVAVSACSLSRRPTTSRHSEFPISDVVLVIAISLLN